MILGINVSIDDYFVLEELCRSILEILKVSF